MLWQYDASNRLTLAWIICSRYETPSGLPVHKWLYGFGVLLGYFLLLHIYLNTFVKIHWAYVIISYCIAGQLKILLLYLNLCFYHVYIGAGVVYVFKFELSYDVSMYLVTNLIN